VAEGTIIEMDLYAMQRNPQIYGADSEEFKPSRWAPGRPLWEAKRQYSPFIGGIRICPAQQMVLAQLTYLLVRIAQEFKEVHNKDPVYRYVEEIKMTVESRNGTKIAVVRA
jgi:cytochrome P450